MFNNFNNLYLSSVSCSIDDRYDTSDITTRGLYTLWPSNIVWPSNVAGPHGSYYPHCFCNTDYCNAGGPDSSAEIPTFQLLLATFGTFLTMNDL